MKVDDIAELYAPQKVGLTIRLLEEEDGTAPEMILVEGRAPALRMLAELLLALAEDGNGQGFAISPKGAGNVHFSKDAQLGIHLHCTKA